MSEPPEQTHVVWHDNTISREQREQQNQHRGCVVWFTGLSGSGKSTLANLVDGLLFQRGVQSFVLDGDNVRHGLNASPELLASHGDSFAQRFGLGFSAEDREENIRRLGSVAELFASAGVVTLTAFVSPYRQDRATVRQRVESSGGKGTFVEVFVDAPLAVCESRDPKGLYKLARAGKISHFTGIDDPYEAPQQPELHLSAGTQNAEDLARAVVDFLVQTSLITKQSE